MNIGIFTDTYPPEINGVATSCEMLKKTLEAHGHKVFIVTTNPFSNKMEYEGDTLRIPGILLKKLYNYRLAWIFHPRATRIIKSWNLDIVHVQTEGGVGLYGRLLPRTLKAPLIYTYHTMYVDYTYYVTKGIMDQPVKTIVKKLSKILCESCDEFTTPSDKTKNALRSYGVDRYINVVPNGIDLDKFERNDEIENKIKRYRKEHNLEDTKILLSLGRVAKEKSIDVLINGYSLFLAKKPIIKTKLFIVGDGPDRANLEKLVSDLNISEHVEFIGKVPYDDVPFYYQLSDLYLSASTSETQGLTFVEAIASKSLVLCRFDENLVEIIKEGVTGFYFSSEESLASKIEQILEISDEKIEEIKNVAYKINMKYSLENFYENMMEVYKRARRKKW